MILISVHFEDANCQGSLKKSTHLELALLSIFLRFLFVWAPLFVSVFVYRLLKTGHHTILAQSILCLFLARLYVFALVIAI